MRALLAILLITAAATTLTAQNSNPNLKLTIIGSTPEETTIIEDYTYPTSFSGRAALESAIDSLSKKLTLRGYFDINKTLTQEHDSLYSATISLGNYYEKLELFIQNDLLLKEYITETGFSIEDNNSIRIETAFAKAYLEQLTTIAANNGNPFASFQISELIKQDQKTLIAKLSLTSDQSRTLDKMTIIGYKTIPKGFLKYYAGFKNGTVFNQERLNAQSESLATLPFINQIKEPDVLFTKDSTTVYLYLKRNNVNRFDGFLGFATDDSNKLRLDGYLDLLLTNNFNYGETFALNYKADGADQSQLSIRAELPYLLKSPLGINARLKLFRRDSTFSTTEQSLNVFYQLKRQTTVALGYDGLQSENLTDNNDVEMENLQDFTSSKITSSFTYTKRSKNFFFPIERQIYIEAGYGGRTTQAITNKQLALNATFENNFLLNDSNSIYLRSTNNYLISDNYLTNELYRFGGILSIRGFDENSIFANLYSTLNTEYRYQLNSSIYINSIIDLAYFENDIESINQKLYSFGLGTGIRTKAGLLKINMSNGKFENLPFQFSNTKLHLILQVSF